MAKLVEEMTDGEVLAAGARNGGRWPPSFTIAQCRAQLAHEQKGCPPPWPGAVWNGYNFEGGRP